MNKVSIWQRFQMPFAASIWLVSAVVLLWLLQGIESSFYIMLSFAVSAIVFFSVSDRSAFFLYILLTLATVFYFLYRAFAEGWTPGEQATGIATHFLFLLHLFALYSIAKYVYGYRKENSALKNKVQELQEYISEQGVLTKREFEKQSEIILSTMARHSEQGYFIQVNLSAIRKTARKQTLLVCSAVISETLRKHYDLVGKLDDHRIVYLLQNIQEDGFVMVQQRVQEALQQQIEEDAYKRIEWNIRQIEGQRSIEELLVVS